MSAHHGPERGVFDARVELGRPDVWVRQVLLDVADGAGDRVRGDVASFGTVRDRVVGVVVVGTLDAGLRELRAAAGTAELGGVVAPAERLRAVLAGLPGLAAKA